MLRDAPDPLRALPSTEELFHALKPSPDRIHGALRSTIAGAVTLVIGLFLQVEEVGLAVMFSVIASRPGINLRWGQLLKSLVALAAMGVLFLTLSGPLGDLPWLMLPVVGTAVALFFAIGQSVAALRIGAMATVITVLTVGATSLLTPAATSHSAGQLILSCALGLSVASLATQFIWPVDVTAALSRSLAGVLRQRRAELDHVFDAFLITDRPPELRKLGDSPGLAANVASYSAFRPRTREDMIEGGRRLALMTLTRHVSSLTIQLSQLIRLRSRYAVADSSEQELLDVKHAIGEAIERYAQCAEQRFGAELDRTSTSAPWPDLRRAVQVLDDAWHRSLRESGFHPARTRIPVLLATLNEFADELRSPPETFIASAEAAAPKQPAHQAYPWPTAHAWTSAGASMLALVCVLVARSPHMITAAWTATTLQETSFGGAVRKTLLRMTGALVGGAIAIVSIIVLAQNTYFVVWPIVWVSLVAFIATYGGQAPAKYAYGFTQLGNTFFLCGIAANPSVSVEIALWRIYGIGVGIVCLFLGFAIFARDTVGNQILRNLAGILQPLPACVRADNSMSSEQMEAIGQLRTTQVSSTLGLFEAVGFEGPASGIAPAAAATALSCARRISVHAMALYRLPIEPGVPEAVRAEFKTVEVRVGTQIQAVVDLLRTTDRLGNPQARLGAKLLSRIAQVAEQPVPDLVVPVDDLEALLASLPVSPDDGELDSSLGEFPMASARFVHLQRIATLLPMLRRAARKTCLPQSDVQVSGSELVAA